MAYVFLAWREKNDDEDGFRIYRSQTPIDVNSPPPPLATLPPDSTTYNDENVDELETYYYRVSTFKGNAEVFSSEISVFADPEAPGFLQASGGVEEIVMIEGVTYKLHTFLESDTFTVTGGTGIVDYVLVGGGGSGGRNNVGGGGGGGGVLMDSTMIGPGIYPIVVGKGGDAPLSTETRGYNGEDSSFFNLVAFGGGGGGAGGAGTSTKQPGLDGGSGGGGGGTWNSSRAAPGGNGVEGQGFGGGVGINNTSTNSRASGGGGGAGQAGANAGDGVGGKGGDGVPVTIRGEEEYFGGGGGGGSNGGTRGLGGLGGGGAGGRGGQICVAGLPNTGGGGGGRSETTPPNTNAPGAAGGSGIVILRYLIG